MPVVSVRRDAIFAELGEVLSPESFDRVCFDFGVEFDGEEKDDDGASVYRVELPANRTDLLCVEGLGRALRTFRTGVLPPEVRVVAPAGGGARGGAEGEAGGGAGDAEGGSGGSARAVGRAGGAEAVGCPSDVRAVGGAAAAGAAAACSRAGPAVNGAGGSRSSCSVGGEAAAAAAGASAAPSAVAGSAAAGVAPILIHVSPSTSSIRPYCFGAVLRGMRFTKENLRSFMDFQDKMHQNIGRRRQLVSMGTHDLAKLRPPFRYDAVAPASFEFVPLNQTECVDGAGVMRLFEEHAQLKAYLPIIRDSPLYPVVFDAAGHVASLPPIINSELSKITLDTRDVLVEVTCTDRTKGGIVLNNLVSAFSKYCETPFTVEAVDVVYEEGHRLLGGRRFRNPYLAPTDFRVENAEAYFRQIIGIAPGVLAVSRVCELLRKMLVDAEPADASEGATEAAPPGVAPPGVAAEAATPGASGAGATGFAGGAAGAAASSAAGGGGIVCRVPPYRADVLHACDLAEDVAIAHGYNNVLRRSFAGARELPANALADLVRGELARCSYHEALNWGLCSRAEALTSVGRRMRDAATPAPSPFEYDRQPRLVQLSNPKTREFEVARGSLIPGLLKTLGANKAAELPIKLFEIGDVCSIDDSTETRTRATKHCAALFANSSGCGLEQVHGLLDHLLRRLGMRAQYDADAADAASAPTGESLVYRLVPFDGDAVDDSTFLPGRAVEIRVGNLLLGVMGAVHPDVLVNFGGVTLPTSLFEINLKPFLTWLPETNLYD